MLDRQTFLTRLAKTPSYIVLDDARLKLALEKAGQLYDTAVEKRAGALRALRPLTVELERRKCVTLKGFVEVFWPILEPEQPLSWNWHLDEECEVVQRAEAGLSDRNIINVPPGTMKSLLISVFTRAYLWSKNPTLRFLTGSYSAHLSVRDNVKLRTLVQSPKYKELFPHVQLTGDQNAKEKFETTVGGWSIATSVGGAGTGEHPDYIFIDDPITEAQSRSDVEREEANKWIDRTLSTRGVVRGVRVFLIMQRLHHLDPSGHLQARGGWAVMVFPMRYVPYRPPDKAKNDPGFTPDPRDQRTQPGQLLWPALFDVDKVRKLELALGPFAAAGQLQQQPVPEGGGLFKRDWFKRVIEAAPINVVRRVRGWDTAGSEQSGDYTCGVRISETDDGLYVIEHVVRDRLSPAGVDALMLSVAKQDGQACPQREEREPGSSGVAVIAARTRLLAGFDHKGQPLSGDKVTRAKPFRAQCEAGNVLLIQGSWNQAFIDELCDFPTGEHDDQVDASSCAFNTLLLEPVVPTFVTW